MIRGCELICQFIDMQKVDYSLLSSGFFTAYFYVFHEVKVCIISDHKPNPQFLFEGKYQSYLSLWLCESKCLILI